MRLLLVLALAATSTACGSVRVDDPAQSSETAGTSGTAGVTPVAPKCVASTTQVRVELTNLGSSPLCAFGALESGAFDATEALDDGVRLVLSKCNDDPRCACAIDVHGVGADLTETLAPKYAGLDLSVMALEPDRVEVTFGTVCTHDGDASCGPVPPHLFAGTADLGPTVTTVKEHVVLELAGEDCSESREDGCESAAFRIKATVTARDASTGRILVTGVVEASEGDDVAIDSPGNAPARLRVLRAGGASEACGTPAELAIGTASWAVY